MSFNPQKMLDLANTAKTWCLCQDLEIASGLAFFHIHPSMIPFTIQYAVMVPADIALNPFTSSIGVLMGSGFGGIITNMIPINPAYSTNARNFLSFIFL